MTKQPFHRLREHIEQTIIGQTELVEHLLIALLAEGHALIEGLPGLAKTTAVQALAQGMALRFQRIQFTPDLIPGDVTGSDIFVPETGKFQFIEGPVFHEIILADEINRAPPKVQSALLEAMQERQVTVGGVSRSLPEIFLVIATQNPIEHEGTFPLPEAQLDRFLLKIDISYPSIDDELEILRHDQAQRQGNANLPAPPALSHEDVIITRRDVNAVYLDDMLARYIVTLVNATRDPAPWIPEAAQWFHYGASPRASLGLARAARAHAFLRERDFVEPGDILSVAPGVMAHRIGLTFAAAAESLTAKHAIQRLLDVIPVP